MSNDMRSIDEIAEIVDESHAPIHIGLGLYIMMVQCENSVGNYTKNFGTIYKYGNSPSYKEPFNCSLSKCNILRVLFEYLAFLDLKKGKNVSINVQNQKIPCEQVYTGVKSWLKDLLSDE